MRKEAHRDDPECPRMPDAVALAQNQMTRAERQAYLLHVATCAKCERAVAEIEQTIKDLADVEEAQCSPGLTARVMSAVKNETEGGRPAVWFLRHPLPAGLAAAAVILACGLWLAIHDHTADKQPPDKPVLAAISPEKAAIEWLLNAQADDGGWRAGEGTQQVSNVGVSALAMLAIMEADEHLDSVRLRESLASGAEYLLSMQHADGLFGPRCAGAPYNQGLATLAMLEMWNRHRAENHRSACGRALVFLKETQDEGGGWSYLGGEPDSVNTSASVWPILAFLKARDLGFEGLDQPLRLGLTWLRTRVSPDGFMGYRRVNDEPYGPHTLTAAGALCLMKSPYPADRHAAAMMLPAVMQTAADKSSNIDFYRFFFVTEALEKAGDPSVRPLLAKVRTRLAAAQKVNADGSGLWDRDDPWTAAGGRVYSTAMAAMSVASIKP